MPGNWHVRFGGGPYGKGPANCGHLAVRPTQQFSTWLAMHKHTANRSNCLPAPIGDGCAADEAKSPG
jgi:hypothetical protein